MTYKTRITTFLIFAVFSVIFFILGLFPSFSFELIKPLLRADIHTDKWLSVVGKIWFLVSLILLSSAFICLFFSHIKNFYKKHNILFFAIFFFFLALLCRFAGRDFESGDYKLYLKPWFDTFKNNRLEAMRTDVGDYTVLYKYFILLFSFVPIKPLYSYKILSIIFDFLLAIYSGLFILKTTNNKIKSLLGYATALFLPNFILNSSVWGQCDSIFSFFVLLSCYYLYLNKEKKCIIYFTLAFSFKIQAIFFLPVLIICIMKKSLRIKSLIWFPITYLIIIFPSILCGMSPLYAMFGAYLKQTTEYKSLVLNAPNLYTMFPDGFQNPSLNIILIGIASAICAILAFVFTNDRDDDTIKLILMSYLFTLLVPFVLPHMHERYFYLSDVFAIIFAYTFTKYYYISIITIFCSLPELISYLFGINSNINLVSISLIMFAGILLLFRVLHKEVKLDLTNQ